MSERGAMMLRERERGEGSVQRGERERGEKKEKAAAKGEKGGRGNCL